MIEKGIQIKDLARETVLVEIIAERDELILSLHQDVMALQAENMMLKTAGTSKGASEEG